VLITNLHRQGCWEVKLHLIFVGVMETIYKVFTGKPVADLNLDYHKVTNLTHKLNEHCIYTHKNKISLQHSLNNNSQGAVLGATAHRQT
jgi:hypothetical protein